MIDVKSCIFCKISSHEIPSEKIYEDDFVYAFADINPVNLGHSLIVPKKHSVNLYDIEDETFNKIMLLAKKIAIAMKDSIKADGVNIEMNNDEAAGQVIFHTHIHVIPRFKNDGFKHWKGLKYNENQIKKTAKKLNKALRSKK